MQYLSLLALYIPSFVLIFAAVLKLADISAFQNLVVAYRLLPQPIAKIVGGSLPCAELMVGCSLILFQTSWSITCAVLLFCLFSVAIAINLLRNRRNLSCGCFGGYSGANLSWTLVMRNIFWCALLIQGSVFRSPSATVVQRLILGVLACALLACWSLAMRVWDVWIYSEELRSQFKTLV